MLTASADSSKKKCGYGIFGNSDFYSMRAQILIVDDEEKLRKLLCRIISLEGYKVVEAGSLSAARQELGHRNIDVVLC